jgi:predicted DNA-binding transcriptional regulator YafY
MADRPRPATSRGSARTRLERILYLLPAASGEDGVSLDELARTLDVKRDVLLADVEEVTARAYYHPAGGGDDLQVFLEADRLRVWTTGEFRRPPKLTPREALALGLGLRVLAGEAGGEKRASLLELARRLETDLASVPVEDFTPHFAIEELADGPLPPGRDPPGSDAAEPPTPGLDPADPPATGSDPAELPATGSDPSEPLTAELRGLLAGAARDGRACGFRYLKADADEPDDRRLEPYALVGSTGRWYAIGRDPDRDDIRAFRLDRMLDVRVLDETYGPAEDFDLETYLSGGRVYRSRDPATARVRYAPLIARWILERGEGLEEPDGSAVVEQEVADPDWAVRHVLQYGGEAELLGPEDLRARVGAAARNVERVHAA